MLLKLILVLTLVPTLELFLLIRTHGWISSHVGSANALFMTIGLIVLTGIIGANLARAQGFAVLKRFQAAANKGVLPTQEIMDGVMILIGGLMLLAPGFISDTLGITLLFPVTRDLYRAALMRALTKAVTSGAIDIHFQGFSGSPKTPSSARTDTIDVEYIEPDKPSS